MVSNSFFQHDHTTKNYATIWAIKPWILQPMTHFIDSLFGFVSFMAMSKILHDRIWVVTNKPINTTKNLFMGISFPANMGYKQQENASDSCQEPPRNHGHGRDWQQTQNHQLQLSAASLTSLEVHARLAPLVFHVAYQPVNTPDDCWLFGNCCLINGKHQVVWFKHA